MSFCPIIMLPRGSNPGFERFQLSGYGGSMTVDAIKDAIASLPLEERHSLAAWLNELEYDPWDKQMVEDFSPGGRGMVLMERVNREIAQGKTSPLQKIRSRAKANPHQPWQ